VQIAVNIEVAFSNPTGMGRYARELLRQILQLDHTHGYTLFHSRQYRWPPPGGGWQLPENFHVRPLPYSGSCCCPGCCTAGRAPSGFIGAHGVYHDLVDIIAGFSTAPSHRCTTFPLMFPARLPGTAARCSEKPHGNCAVEVITVSAFQAENRSCPAWFPKPSRDLRRRERASFRPGPRPFQATRARYGLGIPSICQVSIAERICAVARVPPVPFLSATACCWPVAAPRIGSEISTGTFELGLSGKVKIVQAK
jgi:hypothetical protein